MYVHYGYFSDDFKIINIYISDFYGLNRPKNASIPRCVVIVHNVKLSFPYGKFSREIQKYETSP
jgi:hypothetical protein